MSVTFPRYAPTGYPNQNFTAPPIVQTLAPALVNPIATSYAPATQHFTQGTGTSTEHQPKALPSLPQTPQQLKALAKAVGFIAPAIALAKFAPGQAEHAVKELFPSDWKVWTKLGLGVASMNQLNKALDWTPPAWLGALMNVTMMAGLMTGFSKSSVKVIAILGPCMAGLVQGTQYASGKLEKPLQEKYDVPPMATRLALSIISMGAGFLVFSPFFKWASPQMPKLFQEPETATTSPNLNQAAKPAVISSGCGCCGAPICLNESANYSANAIDSMKRHFTNRKKDTP